MSGCDSGFADCNISNADGCEIDTTGDPANCGSCGSACGPYAHASAVCQNSACAMGVCDAGFADCNSTNADGCEVDTAGDAENCGTCGHACSQGQVCTGGSCVCQDADGDNAGSEPCGADCDDDDATVHPGADEVCDDNIDNDCDGLTDEDCGQIGGGGCGCSSEGGAFSGGLWLLPGLVFWRRRR